jgi:hypothetical protein
MSDYIEEGSHVEYEDRDKKKTGVVTSMKCRSSIGYTTWELKIRPDDGGRQVTKIIGTRYADRVTLARSVT